MPCARSTHAAVDKPPTSQTKKSDTPLRHRTLLEYQRYRYLKVAAFVVLASIIAYVHQTAPVGKYGGTPVGYALGSVAAGFILWLMWFGVRKRQYKASLTSVQGWLSAHIYLGATLVIVATLHTGFQVGWNVHTLAYVLMLAVIASGFFGVYAYLRFPSMQTENLGEDTLDSLILKIADLNKDLERLTLDMPANLANAVSHSVHHTVIGGGVYDQLRQTHVHCPTKRAVTMIEAVNKGIAFKGEQAQALHKLYATMLRKQAMVARTRRDIRYKAMMQIWLYLHVPMSFGLLAALIAHIVSVFFYW